MAKEAVVVKKTGVLVKKDLRLFLRMLLFALVSLLVIFSIFAVNLYFSESKNLTLIVLTVLIFIVPLVVMIVFDLKFLAGYEAGRISKGIRSGVKVKQ